jgi:8-oxo-dGTP pyrophosphatase MutT (NUDIX family)
VDRILLIGQRAVSAKTAVERETGREVYALDRLPLDNKGLSELVRTSAAALVDAEAWEDWQRVPPAKRPHTYVIADGGRLHLADQERYFDGGAVGCVPSDHVEWLLEDMSRRVNLSTAVEDDVAFDVGDLVSVDGIESAEAMATWATGPWAEIHFSLRAIASRLRPLLPKAGPAPFDHLSPSEWLELFAQLELGLSDLLGDKRTADFTAKLTTKLQKTITEFPSLFRHTLIDAGKGTRPQAILVLGETGTGKSSIVRRLHKALEEKTGRGRLPFHRVNCSTLGDMAEVELFGALRGAYTPLSYTNPGAILRSFGGTIFLDEFATLSPSAQAKLLLFLDDGTVKPMAWPGEALRVPVLVVAATNAQLEDLVKRDTFRSDLLHRFRDGRLTLPRLRDTRSRDLPYLVDYLLQTDPANASSTPIRQPDATQPAPSLRVQRVTQSAVDRLMDHDYPGNVRELQAVLATAVDRAASRRSITLTSSDIVFRESTLPRQDSVMAIITRDNDAGVEVFLRLNPHWNKWVLPGGRVEPDETYEACLERQLMEQLRLAADGRQDYTYAPIPVAPPIRMIQDSSRDARPKDYHFHFYRLTVTKEGFEKSVLSTRWVPVSALRSGSSRDVTLSDALRNFDTLWSHLLSPPIDATRTSR